MSHDMTLNWYF